MFAHSRIASRLARIPNRKPRLRRSALVLLIASALAAGTDHQHKRRDNASGSGLCSPCAITLAPIATLGATSDSVDILSSTKVERVNGLFVAAPLGDRAEVGLYTPTGRLQFVFGRQGQGPGEFTNIRSIDVLLESEIAVLDSRITTFRGFPPELSKSKALPPGVIAGRLLALTDGQFLLNNYGPDRPAFCLLSSNLELVRCFGPTGTSRRLAGDELQYLLTRGTGSRFWAAPYMYNHSVEQWDIAGRRRLTLRFSAPWFPTTSAEADLHESPAQVRPLPRLSGIWEDSQGRIWVAVLVPDAAWHATGTVSSARGEGSGAKPTPVADWGKYFDTIIEVFDLRQTAAIASARFPEVLSGFSHEGLLTHLRESDDGRLEAVLLRPTITQTSTRR